MNNQYKPWEDQGITEAEYFKNRFIESRLEFNLLFEQTRFLYDLVERRYKPHQEVEKDLAPMFYHTLSYEGDLKLNQALISIKSMLEELGG